MRQIPLKLSDKNSVLKLAFEFDEDSTGVVGGTIRMPIEKRSVLWFKNGVQWTF